MAKEDVSLEFCLLSLLPLGLYVFKASLHPVLFTPGQMRAGKLQEG